MPDYLDNLVERNLSQMNNSDGSIGGSAIRPRLLARYEPAIRTAALEEQDNSILDEERILSFRTEQRTNPQRTDAQDAQPQIQPFVLRPAAAPLPQPFRQAEKSMSEGELQPPVPTSRPSEVNSPPIAMNFRPSQEPVILSSARITFPQPAGGLTPVPQGVARDMEGDVRRAEREVKREERGAWSEEGGAMRASSSPLPVITARPTQGNPVSREQERRSESQSSIQVTIGRIEIRATPMPPAPPRKEKTAPESSLEEYLKRRDGGK